MSVNDASNRNQALPDHVKQATSYQLLPGAHSTSAEGTLRASRWAAIVKYSGLPNGVSLAKRESGVSKRHLYQLERHNQLRFNTSMQSDELASEQPRPDSESDARSPQKTPVLPSTIHLYASHQSMSISQAIQSQDVSVAQVLQSFYVVPNYQREYVWGQEQVEQLLIDVFDELGGASASDAPEYFIGSIVVCPGEGGMWELIDGQQRITTIYITLCAIRDHLVAIGQSPPLALAPQISAASTDANGIDVFRNRLELQYEDSGTFLSQMATGEPKRPNGVGWTGSMENMMGAYEAVRRFLDREFSSEPALVRSYYGYLTNKVKLIRIETQDVAKALKVFETVNDRGVGLNSMDLLKNLLFMRADRAAFDELKTLWKQLQDVIYGMNEKPLRFLRYFIISHFDVLELREDQIYGWLTKNEDLCGYGTNPLNFAQELVASAQAFANYIGGRDKTGQPHPQLQSLQFLGGRLRMHLILLLAGRQLTRVQFDHLVKEIEDLFFCFLITREHTRTIDNHLARWATELRKVRTDDELQIFLKSSIRRQRAAMSVRFDEELNRLSADVIAKYRLMYVIAKLSQQIEVDAFGETEGNRWLDKFTHGGFEIEHILPRNPSPQSLEEFGGLATPEVVQLLGNLVLVEKSINASLGNRPYSQKRDVYRQSQLLLTRSLTDRPRVGNTRIDSAVAGLPTYEVWTEQSIRSRQNFLSTLARRVWSVPD